MLLFPIVGRGACPARGADPPRYNLACRRRTAGTGTDSHFQTRAGRAVALAHLGKVSAASAALEAAPLAALAPASAPNPLRGRTRGDTCHAGRSGAQGRCGACALLPAGERVQGRASHPARACPLRWTGQTSVVSTVTCTPCQMGNPLATTSLRRASLAGRSRFTSRSAVLAATWAACGGGVGA